MITTYSSNQKINQLIFLLILYIPLQIFKATVQWTAFKRLRNPAKSSSMLKAKKKKGRTTEFTQIKIKGSNCFETNITRIRSDFCQLTAHNLFEGNCTTGSLRPRENYRLDAAV